MKPIKVSVSYECPQTTRFDELFKQYTIAKQIADETVSYYEPLAEAAEEAKMTAILDQLKNIKRYCYQIASLKTSGQASISTLITGEMRDSCGGLWFTIQCTIKNNIPEYYIKWGNVEFSIDTLKRIPHAFTGKGFDILKNWDEWKVYKDLEDDAIYKIKSFIETEEKRGKTQIERLNNMIK